jgi:hypothetical protein
MALKTCTSFSPSPPLKVDVCFHCSKCSPYGGCEGVDFKVINVYVIYSFTSYKRRKSQLKLKQQMAMLEMCNVRKWRGILQSNLIKSKIQAANTKS